MRERLLTVLLALGALVLFYFLIFPKPQRPPAARGLPVSTDGRPEGYLSIWRWLGREHIPRVSLRYRYGRLPHRLAKPTGNLLIITLPQRVPMQAEELDTLRTWIARGNTVLIAAALDDTPLWAADTDDPVMMNDLKRLTGLKFLPTHASTPLSSPAVDHLYIRPRGAHPLLSGVRRIVAPLPPASRSWRAYPTRGRLTLELAARRPGGLPVLWLERFGRGQIILSALAGPFCNAGLAIAGNARLLANIVSWSRSPGGAVVFDDAHEGLSAFYDAWAFFADPRLHATLIWIVLLWLIFVVGSQPLRPGPRAWQPPDESAYIEGSARYLAAVVEPGQAARRLIEDFLGELPGSPDRGAARRWLASQAGIAGADRTALNSCDERCRAGRRVNLTRLHSLLARLRRNLI